MFIEKKSLPLIIKRLIANGGEDPPESFKALFEGDMSRFKEEIKKTFVADIDTVWPQAGLGLWPCYSMLQWAICLNNGEACEELTRSGARPNKYIHESGMTAVGMAGYMRNIKILKIFKSFGADFRLILSSQNLSAGASNLECGSTLLHRVASSKTASQTDKKKKVRTCVWLLREYQKDGLDPWPRDQHGVDVARRADMEVKAALLKELADYEGRLIKNRLKTSTALPEKRKRSI